MKPNAQGELAEEDFKTLLQTGTREDWLQAAIMLKPSDPRARLLIRRYEESRTTKFSNFTE